MRTQFALSSLALAAISLNCAAPVLAQSWPRFDSQPADAKLRYDARQLARELEQPSCLQLGVPKGFDRAEALAPEKAAIDRFRARLRGTPAYFHFTIAEEDARHEQMHRSGCWNDSETWLAEKHVKDAKEATKLHLEAAEKLIVKIRNPGNLTSVVAEKAVDFRARVRDLTRSSQPRCRLTTKGDNDEIAGAARQAVIEFRQELGNGPYSVHFDIANGDVNLDYAISDVECDEPSSRPKTYWSKLLLQNVQRQILNLRLIMKAASQVS